MKHYGYEGLAILVSERGHYSLKKAADVLGIGQEGLVSVKTDNDNRICTEDLRAEDRATQTEKHQAFRCYRCRRYN